jgi:hypothetical protein
MRRARNVAVATALVHFLSILRPTSSQERLYPICFACGCDTCKVGNYEGRVSIPQEIRDQVDGFSEISCFQLSQAGLVGLIPPDICSLNKSRELQQACQCPPLPPSPAPTNRPSLARTGEPTTQTTSALPTEPSNATADATAAPSAEPMDASQPTILPTTVVVAVSQSPSWDEGIASTESDEPSSLVAAPVPSPRPNMPMPSLAPLIATPVQQTTLGGKKMKNVGKEFKKSRPSKSSKSGSSVFSDRKESGHKKDGEKTKSDKRSKDKTSKGARHKKVRSGKGAREKLIKQHRLR